jgi:hypothetical protein
MAHVCFEPISASVTTARLRYNEREMPAGLSQMAIDNCSIHISIVGSPGDPSRYNLIACFKLTVDPRILLLDSRYAGGGHVSTLSRLARLAHDATPQGNQESSSYAGPTKYRSALPAAHPAMTGPYGALASAGLVCFNSRAQARPSAVITAALVSSAGILPKFRMPNP